MHTATNEPAPARPARGDSLRECGITRLNKSVRLAVLTINHTPHYSPRQSNQPDAVNCVSELLPPGNLNAEQISRDQIDSKLAPVPCHALDPAQENIHAPKSLNRLIVQGIASKNGNLHLTPVPERFKAPFSEGGVHANRRYFARVPDDCYKVLYPNLDFSRVAFYSGLPAGLSAPGWIHDGVGRSDPWRRRYR